MDKNEEAFLEMVVHDLKSPINAEINALNLLLKDNKFKKNEILIDLLQAAKYMKNLVDNILFKYKFENSNISFNKSYYPLNILIKDCITEIRYLTSDKKLKILFEDYKERSIANFDIIEIKRVIINLISNAIEHAPKNTSIIIKLTKNPDCFMVSVENKLKELPPKNINDIFEKFVSFANKSKRVNIGLGLYISKKIVDLHKGIIFAEVLPDNIIRISFTLPIKR